MMTASVRPVLIKRAGPDSAPTQRASLNLYVRIALLTILVSSALFLVWGATDGGSALHLGFIPSHRVTTSEVRRSESYPRTAAGAGAYARNRKVGTSQSLLASSSRHRAAAGEAPDVTSVASEPVRMSKPMVILFEYQDLAGRLASHLGYYDAAISYFSEAIEKFPKDGRVRDERAEIYWRIGQTALAQSDFEEALVVNPKDTAALTGLAWLLGNSPNRSGRDHKRAITLAQQACVLTRWHDARTVEALAAAYAAAGAFDKAIKTQGQALALEHDSSRSANRFARYAQHQTAD